MRRNSLIGFTGVIIISGVFLLTNCGDDDKSVTPPKEISYELHQVTTEGSDPNISADGQWMIYRISGTGIVKQKIGTDSYTVLSNIGLEPHWCHANNLVVFRSGGVLFVMNANTGDTTLLRIGGFDDGPCWSPLGNEIACQDSWGIRIVAYPGGDTSYVTCSDTLDAGCEGESPTWSPDGQEIAFEDGVQILKVARSGGTATPVVYDLNDVAYPAWSPDGNYIAFTMDDATYQNAHIWVADARGVAHGLWQVTDGAFFDTDAAWSPDSKLIYFERKSVDSAYYYTPLGIWSVGFQTE